MDRLVLRIPTPNDLGVVYRWKLEEPRSEYYTCRPVRAPGSLEEYLAKAMILLEDPGKIQLVLAPTDGDGILGDINGFDWIERNHSMEFGYYLPGANRSKGYGGAMVRLFLRYAFEESSQGISKLNATTSDGNEPSKRILEREGFTLDGRNREHYWIRGERYGQRVYSMLSREREAMERATR